MFSLGQSPHPFLVRASMVAVLGLSIVGCSENKSAQCVKLIGVANGAVNSIEAVTTPPGTENNIDALNKIASVADETNRAMKDLTLTDPKLQEFRSRFTAMYTDTSTATRALVDASTKKDTTASQKAYEDLKNSTSKESPLVDEVNGYCSTAGG